MRDEDTVFPLLLALIILALVLVLNMCSASDDDNEGSISNFVTKDIFIEF